MASRQSNELVDLFRRLSGAIAADPGMSMTQMRAVMEHLGDATAEPRGVDYIEVDAGGVPALWAVPRHSAEDRVLLCLLGGGYISGSMYSHRKMYAHYARRVGCRALIIDYPLAPESPHPGPVNGAVTAYGWLLDQGLTPDHLAIVGDSAGGGMAIATLVRLRGLGLPLPVAAMPLSAWVDMELTWRATGGNNGRDALVSPEMSEFMVESFLGGGDRRDPLANPLLADLRGLPPVYLQAGGFEALLEDSRALAAALNREGVDVRLEVVPEMQHIFNLLAGTAPEADEAIGSCARWVRPKLGL